MEDATFVPFSSSIMSPLLFVFALLGSATPRISSLRNNIPLRPSALFDCPHYLRIRSTSSVPLGANDYTATWTRSSQSLMIALSGSIGYEVEILNVTTSNDGFVNFNNHIPLITSPAGATNRPHKSAELAQLSGQGNNASIKTWWTYGGILMHFHFR